MGTAGFLRSLNATINRIDKANKKIARENEKRNLLYQKQLNFKNAQDEVESFNQYLNDLKTLHCDCSDIINWNNLYNLTEPSQPIMQSDNEKIAEYNFINYRPSWFDKFFKKDKVKLKELESSLESAKLEDKRIFQSKLREYNSQLDEIRETKDIAKKIIEKDMKTYLHVLQEIMPFKNISYLGSEISIKVINQNILKVEIDIKEENIIPKESKTLLKSGKVSSKPFPITKYYEIYQDYICSVSLRIAREIFALLPIEKVIINSIGEKINTSTGYKEKCCILSVLIPKYELLKLNFTTLDASDSMNNFLCNMSFVKSSGFKPINEIDISNII